MYEAIVTVDDLEKGTFKLYKNMSVSNNFLSRVIKENDSHTDSYKYGIKSSIYIPIEKEYGKVIFDVPLYNDYGKRLLCLKNEKEVKEINGTPVGKYDGNTSLSFAIDVTIYEGIYKLYDSCLIRIDEKLIISIPYLMLLKEDE